MHGPFHFDAVSRLISSSCRANPGLARSNGVLRSLLVIVKSAPWATSSFASSTRFSSQARCNGVLPYVSLRSGEKK